MTAATSGIAAASAATIAVTAAAAGATAAIAVTAAACATTTCVGRSACRMTGLLRILTTAAFVVMVVGGESSWHSKH